MSKSFASKKKSRLVSIGILLFIILIIPLTVIIAQQVQDIRQRATDSQNPPPLPPGGAVSLTMTPNIFNLTIGAATPTSAQIAINAGSNNITGVDFTLSYNPAMIKVVGFTPATGFDQELYKTIDSTTGKLRFAAVDTTTATANTGSVAVGTVQFSGLTVGTSTGIFQSVQITALGYTGALPNTTNDTATFTTAAQATFTPVPPTATATVPPATNTPTQAPLPGNFNGDSVVDILDFNRWRNEFTKVAATLTADANGDGKVDLIDFSFWRNNFGTTSPTPTVTPTPITATKRVFLTSTTYNGNLGGLSGADAKCQSRATAANLGGTWKAWLSDATTSAASRVTHTNGKYNLINGTVVANNWADLTDGTLQNAINTTELNTTPNNTSLVWTNTAPNGNSLPASGNQGSCNNFTNASNEYSLGGINGAADGQWTQWSTDMCSSSHTLYCFEQ